jgi:hypothetical protein
MDKMALEHVLSKFLRFFQITIPSLLHTDLSHTLRCARQHMLTSLCFICDLALSWSQSKKVFFLSINKNNVCAC